MAITNILNTWSVNNEWTKVSNIKSSDCYLIAVKGKKGKKDTIDIDDIVQLNFGVAIDSGVANEPIVISRFSINFNESEDKKKGYCRLKDLPETFYIKLLALTDKNFKTINNGTATITININSIK